MNTLAEATEWFQNAGWIAFPRTWALGETILVAASKEEHQGINILRHAVYLYWQDGIWRIFCSEATERHFEQLQDAVLAIHKWLLEQTKNVAGGQRCGQGC